MYTICIYCFMFILYTCGLVNKIFYMSNILYEYYTCGLVKGIYISFKSSYLHEIFPVLTKIAFLSRRHLPLATLLYEQFIHLT